MHRLDHGMLGAERAANAGEGDVEGVGRCSCCRGRSGLTLRAANLVPRRASSPCIDALLEFIDALPHVALGIFRGRLQPKIVDLGEHAVLARHPAIAECFPVGFGLDRRGFFFQRGQQLLDSLVQRGRREAL